LGYYRTEVNKQYTAETKQALWDFCGTENLEERWQTQTQIDPQVLRFLQQKARE
jgi:hypothetical protein